MFSHEAIVREMRIAGQHAIDGLHLPGTQILMRIEAPTAGEQPLASQDLVNAGDAAGELVGRIEERGVDVRQLRPQREQPQHLFTGCPAEALRRRADGTTTAQEIDRALRPDRPLTEQATGKPQSSISSAHWKWR